MNRKITLFLSLALALCVATVNAGNPDRQGEAGAYELLLNPWARTIGLHSMNTATVRGIEAMNQNIAGLSRINRMEFGVGHSIYLQGTGVSINALGFSQKVGKSGALGISINAMSFGKIPVTTTALPEGTGATFSPTFFNLGLSYAHQFEEKVSVGLTLRLINESLADISAFGFSIDAGVQYHTGPKEYADRFKFGIALRNIGSPMRFGGQGLNAQLTVQDAAQPYILRVSRNGARFELPSQLYIGAAYDVIPQAKNKVTLVGNFTSNAFSRDEVGGGVEFSLNNIFVLRGGYKYEMGVTGATTNRSVYTGVCGGLSVQVPMGKNSDRTVAIDYGYLSSSPWNGTHNFSLRLNL